MALSDRTRADLAKAERRRMIEAAGREARTREAQAVRAGIVEGVQLGEARGEAFDAPKAGRGERDKPVRRLSGVEFLWRANKLDADQLRAAQAYGSAYRMAAAAPGLRSCLGDHTPGGEGPSIAQIGAAASARVNAQARLIALRAKLSHQRAMVEACDLILGAEQTPREAGGNALGAAVYTALVLAALDLIAGKATTTTGAQAA